MKKSTVITLAVCLFGLYAHAQRKIEYGFNIGGGLGIQHINNPAILLNNSIRTFNMDASVSFLFLKKYYLRTGLAYENKGTVYSEDALTTTNKITYIEIPLTVVRKFEIPTLGKLVSGVGGYFAMGNEGTLFYETPGSSNSNYVSFGSDNDFLKYDGGIRLISGLELNNRLTFNLAYDFGLYNIASESLKGTGYSSVYNREFTIKLGIIF